MLAQQRGATLIGVLIIGGILGTAIYGLMRVWPAYFEYMEVVRAMEQTAKEHSGEGNASVDILRNSLERRWTIEDIKTLDFKEVAIKRSTKGGGFTMNANYRYESPFIGNVSLVVNFDKTVDVR